MSVFPRAPNSSPDTKMEKCLSHGPKKGPSYTQYWSILLDHAAEGDVMNMDKAQDPLTPVMLDTDWCRPPQQF